MHGKRVLSAVVFIPLFIWLVERGPFVLFWLLITAVSCIGLYEIYAILEKAGMGAFTTFGIAAGGILSLIFLYDVPFPSLVFAVLSCFFTFLYALFFYEDIAQVIRRICGTLLGEMYVPFLLCHVLLVWKLPEGRNLVLALMILIWMGDTGAYYVGNRFGKRKIAPSISPGKTLAGVWGGFAGNLIGAFFLKTVVLSDAFSFARIAVIALFVGGIGQLGDLFESLLKRGSAIKDSGVIIPGHGGILDRLDSLLFAAPVFFYMVR